LRALCNHGFPGNVRELENLLERAMALCDGRTITPDDLGLEAGETVAIEGSPTVDAPADIGQGLEQYLADVERAVILQTLEQTRWNRTAAARALGISFRALRYRLEKLGLDTDAPAGDPSNDD
jgi:two-component system response regulator PilR (NtrC family)